MNVIKYKNYNGHSAYMMKYQRLNGDFKLRVSFGNILNISEKEGDIAHQIDSGMCSLGSPILNYATL